MSDETKQILSEARGVRVWVPGRPRTKGSLKPVHVPGRQGARCKVGLREDGEYSVPWKKRMIVAIRQQAACERYAGAVEVHAFFRFEVDPDSRGSWPTSHEIGDEDKLRRNLLDALTQSALILDDALVVGGMTVKRWAHPGEQAGVTFVVRPADLNFMIDMEAAAIVLPGDWVRRG